MRVRLYVDVDLSGPVDDDELDDWARTIWDEFGERLRLDAPVTGSERGWEVLGKGAR